MIKNIVNLGDAAIYCDFGEEVTKDVNSKVIKYFRTLKNKNLKGVTNLAPSYNKLIITFDLNETTFIELKNNILNLKLDDETKNESSKISIPICCDKEYSLDIDRLEEKLNKSIMLDRLETPRVKVPKGSVGLTEQFCNIYTFESPGGWNIIGNTPIKIFNSLSLSKPNLINPGDEVSFYEINKKEYLKVYNE